MRVAVCQFAASESIAHNARTIVAYAEEAGRAGADLLVCPEAAMIRLFDKSSSLVGKVEELDGSFGQALAAASKEWHLTIVAGGFTPGDDRRVKNTLFVASEGVISAHYDKIHLYDAFADKESDKVKPGTGSPVVIEVAGIKVGLATCYDLRFPEIFRALIDKGAQAFVLPAAWIKGSLKEEHWQTLLRARAIENSAYMVASGETGERAVGRSMVFDPMGLQLTDLGYGPGMACVDLDPERVRRTREINPSLDNRRFVVRPCEGGD